MALAERTKAKKTLVIMRAADVITRAVAASPVATA
jgi:hypothetical protein